MSVNGARGEAIAVLAGEERRLCLTLGALAEIETALGVSGVAALAERMRALSARDLMAVLAALLRGGGEGSLAGALDRAAVDPVEAAEAVALAFAASSGRAGA
ncbi:GTA-gp10 family protein [Brevundimonas staleyi]|uniref:GTA-gp10 family protein n=1 Tax=Brevundimonas staleyi TaxID=74326 RepID=A0ABW0FNG3_9CAUL